MLLVILGVGFLLAAIGFLFETSRYNTAEPSDEQTNPDFDGVRRGPEDCNCCK